MPGTDSCFTLLLLLLRVHTDGTLHLTREGGHTNRRIVHAADLTGREIERALLASARSHPNISFHEHHLATELVVDEAGGVPHCFGVDVLDQRNSSMTRFLGLATMLATGGAGQVYPSTTNPHVATGDGMAMAYRAGAAISNMEFVQFHPTALYSPPKAGASSSGSSSSGATERTFLITEAVRGEGGMLFNLKGEWCGIAVSALVLCWAGVVVVQPHACSRSTWVWLDTLVAGPDLQPLSDL